MSWITAPRIKLVLTHWVSAFLLVQLIAWLFSATSEHNPLWLLTYAYATFIAAVLLRPAAHADGAGCLLWSFGAGLVFPLSATLTGASQPGVAMLVQLSLGVMLLVWLATGISNVLAARFKNPENASLAVLCCIALATATPVWLGPIVEVFASRTWLVDAVVGLSPLSYLSALAEIDYLRTDWFYQNTPFGGLRFAYPSVIPVSLFFFVAGIAVNLAGKNFQKPR